MRRNSVPKNEMEGTDLVDDLCPACALNRNSSDPLSLIMDMTQDESPSPYLAFKSSPKPLPNQKPRQRRRLSLEWAWTFSLVLVVVTLFSTPSTCFKEDYDDALNSSPSSTWSSSSSPSVIAPSPVLTSTGPEAGDSVTYFTNGLANSMPRINGTLLREKSEREPFQIHFRTACPFGNILSKEGISVGLNDEGKLSYTSKIGRETRVHSSSSNMADGQWHVLTFNGSLRLPNWDEAISIPITNVRNGQNIETAFIKFFDGFVGCIKLTTPNGGPILSTGDEYLNVAATPTEVQNLDDGLSFADYFQLHTMTAYVACEDLNLNLAHVHRCPDPATFVLCGKCRNGGRCEVVEEEESSTPSNVCLCQQNNYIGKYCEIPIAQSQDTNDAPSEVLSMMTSSGTSGGDSAEILVSAGATVVQSNVSSNATSSRPNSGRAESTSTSSSTPSTTTLHPSISESRSNATDVPSGCPCKHGGVCLSNSATTSMEVGVHICSCEGTGFYGERCEIENLFCRSSPCVHGICQPKGDSYQCYCLPGFAGSNCDINFNECLSNPCGQNGVCIDDVNAYKCTCNAGYIGTRCETEINECETAPCQNGGTCHDAVANYTCDCVLGFTGHNCSVNIDECESGPCQNNGVCIDGINSFSCNCSDTGFEGFYCDREINDCLSSPCENGGTCKDRHKGFTCLCHHGYQGAQCEFDYPDCHDEPCQHNSTCYEKSNVTLYNAPPESTLPSIFHGDFSYENASGHECLCLAGFEGPNCETNIDECVRKPCNYGKCIDGINNFTCDCNNGYTGPVCDTEINECDPPQGTGNPCVRGTCVDQVADYFCQCPEGYGSKNCSVALIGCNGVTCFNVGSCSPTYINNTHGHKCLCAPGWAGGLCQRSTTLSFGGSKGGYAELVSDDENYRSRYAMSFRFRTTLSEVLIAVGQGSTYFMLTLSGGKLNLQSSLLNSLKGISSGNNVSNAEWHQAWVAINETHIALGVNQEQTIHPIQTEPEQPVETGFNTTVLGGATSGLSALSNLPAFVGCIQDIQINDKKIVPEEKPDNLKYDPLLVQIGCQRTEQCASNNSPCLNGGTCTDLWTKFECQCPRPFLGEICSFEYVAATFGHENTSISVIEVHISNEIGRKFDKSFEISMFVRTREPRGTIFLLKEEKKENNGLFLEAYVEDDGQLGVLAKLDEGKEETYKVGGLAINDGEPHLISFQRERGLVKINVNGTEHFRRSLPLKPTQVFNPSVMLIGGVPSISDPETTSFSPIDSSPFSWTSTGRSDDVSPSEVTVDSNPTSSTSSRVTRAIWNNKMEPFKGVIQDVRVNLSTDSLSHHQNPMLNRYVVEFFPLTQVNKSFLMGEPLGQVIKVGQVLRGVVSDNSCRMSPCRNGGECEVTWNDFKCRCSTEFDGKMCEHLLPCAIVTCPNGSTCKNLYSGKVNGFECEAEASFDGHSRVSPHYHFRSEVIDNLTFNQISFRYRAQHGGSILHMVDRINGTSVKVGLEEVWNSAANASDPHLVVYVNGTRLGEKLSKALDGLWHTVKLTIHPETQNLILLFDGVERKTPLGTHLPQNLLKGILSSRLPEIVIGSFVGNRKVSYNVVEDATSVIPHGLNGTIFHDASLHEDLFRGCLSDVRIGEYRLPFISPTQLFAINTRNHSLIETTAPSAFYMDEPMETAIQLGCLLCYNHECQNGGKCEDALEKYDCQCEKGFTGNFCQVNVNECAQENTCAFGSTCVDQIANYTCHCVPGYTGWRCDVEIDECAAPNPCQTVDKDAVCEDRIGSFACHCSTDYIGLDCSKRKLSSCRDEPCENNAACLSTVEQLDGTSFSCNCQQGYTGKTCGSVIDYCQDVNCSDHGTCVNRRVGAECRCTSGWTGPKCETSVDDCAVQKQLCKNNGVCIDGHNSFTCNCTGTGYKGDHCDIDIDECMNPLVNKCSYNSTCVNSEGNFTCMCFDGFCGRSCDMVDPCWPDYTCANEGTCVAQCDLGFDPLPKCECKDPFSGGNCTERKLASSLQSTTINVVLIVIPVLTAFLVSVIIAAVILVRMARKKRATRGVYSPSQQEYCNPRVELDNVMKPPPEERLI